MVFNIKVECPRCGKIWSVPQGTPDITCDCHLFCQDGVKPSDCTLTAVSFSGKLGGFTGLHINGDMDQDDELHRTYWCTTHSKYSRKTPVLIEIDADYWFSHRAPKGMRELGINGAT